MNTCLKKIFIKQIKNIIFFNYLNIYLFNLVYIAKKMELATDKTHTLYDHDLNLTLTLYGTQYYNTNIG